MNYECIDTIYDNERMGDSLQKINDNFACLDTNLYELSGKLPEEFDPTQLVTDIQGIENSITLLSRGHINGLVPSYVNGTTVKISKGIVDIKGQLVNFDEDITVNLVTDNFPSGTNRGTVYFYAKNDGTILTSLTAPSWNSTYQGWYLNNDRYIVGLRSPRGSDTIMNFYCSDLGGGSISVRLIESTRYFPIGVDRSNPINYESMVFFVGGSIASNYYLMNHNNHTNQSTLPVGSNKLIMQIWTEIVGSGVGKITLSSNSVTGSSVGQTYLNSPLFIHDEWNHGSNWLELPMNPASPDLLIGNGNSSSAHRAYVFVLGWVIKR